ncbi:MAG: circularly permuted type 2 ATP-grasp protein [Acetobacterales bacterium]
MADDTDTTSLPLLRDYRPLPGIFDEMMTADGGVREHWRSLLRALDGLGVDGLKSRDALARRLIHEDGITYNVYGDPAGISRPWELDVVPLVVPPTEWVALEAGLIQRARLLNAALTDIYGRQTMLREGRLPASLVFGNPQFLRPLHGASVPNGTFLHIYAADLGRSPDGRWWVINDRTQAPSGVGYTLENRIVTGRALPDIMQAGHVRRQAYFFYRMRESLRDLASHREDPVVVLLTPGPFNETYFEHVYLARYLGFPLVEGGDLTVRDSRVYMKTVAGLRQIDVILRRVDDDWCDPLELRETSAIGVPGLVQAARAGNVAIANALGSGVVESQGFMGFLPGLCRHLLGEELIIPNVATWWCGHEKAAQTVIDRLDSLVVRQAFRPLPGRAETPPVMGAELTAGQREDLIRRIRARGYDFVGQETVTLSTAPVFDGEVLRPGSVVLRAYVAAVGDSWIVMPGGLTRVASQHDTRTISMQEGYGSKDAWLMAEGPVGSFSLLPSEDEPAPLRRSGTALPSRAADDLYWLGRYAERSEGIIRLLRALLARLVGDADPEQGRRQLRLLMDVLVAEDLIDSAAKEEHEAGAAGGPVDPRFTEGLRLTIGNLFAAGTRVRDRLSADAWRIISRLNDHAVWQEPALGIEIETARANLDEMVTLVSAFSGMEMENMTRGMGWTFLDIGRRVERALHGTMLLDALLLTRQGERRGTLELLLELADCAITYRTRYISTPQLAPVVDLLLVDDSNPRSVLFQLRRLEDRLRALPRGEEAFGLAPEQRILRDLLTRLELADVHDLCAERKGGGARPLDALLTRLIERLPQISNVIANTYFAHVEVLYADRAYARGRGRGGKP